MDFFGAQAHARQQTRWLVALFVAAVIAVIVAVYAAVVVVLGTTGGVPGTFWDPGLFAAVALATTLFIGAGSTYKIHELAAGGGDAVAASLGGRLVSRASGDPLERRLLNVVDEMAIASGVSTPRVYLLDDEQGINAFAAGFTTQQAVVAVTRSALERLTRDELQGVVAHEFSHILNGDMRLNLRLIGVLHGILLLAVIGRIILRGSRRGRSKNGGGIVFLGAALLAIGYVGVLFGNLIKAATSRQREFLADASAVQFTRNPGGIAGALKKIAGIDQSAIRHPRAEEASHLFFGAGVASLFGLLATHPPIEERIRRIDRSFRMPQKTAEAAGAAHAGTTGFASGAPLLVTPRQVTASVGTVGPAQIAYAHDLVASLPATLTEAYREPDGARALVYALLVTGEPAPAKVLRETIVDEPDELIERASALVADLAAAGRAAWLPVLELAMPALAEAGRPRVERLLANVKQLVEADKHITLFEYLLHSLLRASLAARPGDQGKTRRAAGARVTEDASAVLSLLVQLGHRDMATTRRAFAAATAVLAPGEDWTMRDDVPLSGFDAALTRLAGSDYGFRERLIEACSAAVVHDGQVTVEEAELLRIVGAKLDCPIPPLLAAR